MSWEQGKSGKTVLQSQEWLKAVVSQGFWEKPGQTKDRMPN